MISRIIERGLAKQGRRVRLSMPLTDRPGALCRLLLVVADSRVNVISVRHERVDPNVPLGLAEVGLTLETRDPHHTQELLTTLRREGYDVRVLDQKGQ